MCGKVIARKCGQAPIVANRILIEAQFEPPLDFLTTPVQARVEATRGSEHIVIAEGDIRSIELN